MLNVLIVDDSDDTVEMVSMLVRRRGHQVRGAQTAGAALELAAARAPDVVLLDLGLPDLSGLDLARRLRASGLTDALLVAVTGHSRESDRQAALEAGCDDFLSKPLRRKVLDRVLQDAIARRSAAS